MNLKLFNSEENYVVESMSIGDSAVEFVHDTETGDNFFNQKTLVELFGVSVGAISKHLNKYLKDLESNSTNSRIPLINLKTNNRTKRVKFYGFNAVTYLAFRINTPEAIEIQNTINSLLNKMFNVATGKDSINTNKDWLKTQCEVKQLQALNAKSASKLLYDADLKDEAEKIWHTYKRLDAEALKYKEKYIDYERLDKEVAYARSDRTKQLKLI